ncbi:uncharacterized protein LOC106636730 [Copidosoma floridanum]|uniref:uncharacterized protein LOC106636730 n=1 Tax=Copidosoma floridanum TaxID=29053 RepID=UPI0006C98989|nr:uncharacterized protein LOC106636730 [Copidosoma floridanum]
MVNKFQAYCFEPVNGLKVNYFHNELIVQYSPVSNSDSFKHVSSRDGDSNYSKKKKGNVMQRIRSFLMMIPIGIQLLSVPIQLASVKILLIRSILVANVAIFMLLLRLLLSAKSSRGKIVIVKAPSKEVHEHFYHPFAETKGPESNWLDNPPPWIE